VLNKLVLENLKYRWIRTLLNALVVGVRVMSILTLIGLSRGMLQDVALQAKGTGADIFLAPDTQSIFTFSTGQLPQEFVEFVQKQPHVEAAVGVLMIPVGLITPMNGVDIPRFEKMNGGLRFLQGRPPQGRDDLIVDEYYAQQNKLHVGQTVNLLNHDWRVCGIVRGGMLGRLIVQLPTLQRLTGTADPPRISQILVKLDDPALTEQQVVHFNHLLRGNLQAISTQALVSQFSVSNIRS
jgi:putative ABC transport system permease protein